MQFGKALCLLRDIITGIHHRAQPAVGHDGKHGENAERYQLHNVSLLQSHWFASLGETKRYELIISNPPYVAANDPHLQQGDVRFEPQAALVAGIDGLDAIRHLIPQSKPHLLAGGWLLLEHGYDQGERVRQLFNEHGYVDVQQKQDLAGHVRVTMGRG